MDDLNLLTLKAQKGDKEAFGKIYVYFYKRIYRYCYFNLKAAEAAEDITQETFIKAWKSLPTFRIKKGGSLQAYLFRIARNLIIDLSRKKKEVTLDSIGEIEKEEDFEELIDKKTDTEKVRKALAKLDDLEKQIVLLRFFEDLSFTEVSKVTGVAEGNLRVKVHRTLKKLKDILEKI